MKNILIIDDERSINISLSHALEDTYSVFTSEDPIKGYDVIEKEQIDLVLLDLKIGKYEGLEVLKEIKKMDGSIQVIMMTAYGSIKTSIDAIKSGAYYYITKPIDLEELKLLIHKALEFSDLNHKVKQLSEELDNKYSVKGIIGRSPKMLKLFDTIDKVKNIDSNILIIGESGTGKEMVAKAIHYQGMRKNNRFEAINCAAIPSHLLESELFGYKQGAFTGAMKDKKGKFQMTHSGTIFFDELGEMELSMQSKLLRVIEDKEVTPLGSNVSEKVDVRIIAATNVDLKKAVEEGTFRKDLYYRLNVITMKLPPLRERKEDISVLINHFVEKYNKHFNKEVTNIEPSALKILENYTYKGNVRELENIIERAIALSSSDKISIDDLSDDVVNFRKIKNKGSFKEMVGMDLKSIEKEVILETLNENDGVKHKTASMLGISERTLRNKLIEYEVEK